MYDQPVTREMFLVSFRMFGLMTAVHFKCQLRTRQSLTPCRHWLSLGWLGGGVLLTRTKIVIFGMHRHLTLLPSMRRQRCGVRDLRAYYFKSFSARKLLSRPIPSRTNALMYCLFHHLWLCCFNRKVSLVTFHIIDPERKARRIVTIDINIAYK